MVNYTQWCFYIGINDETVLNLALAFDSPDSPNIAWGDCYRAKGELLQQQGAMADAEKAFQRSVELSRQAQDAICEGNATWGLGELYMRQNRIGEAEAAFEKARRLSEQSEDLLGAGNATRSLGHLHMQRYQLDEAEDLFMQAAGLYKQIQDTLGEGNTLLSLGRLYQLRGKLDEAEITLKKAIDRCKQAQARWSEGTAVQTLGNVYMQQGHLDEAEAAFLNSGELVKGFNSSVMKVTRSWHSEGCICALIDLEKRKSRTKKPECYLRERNVSKMKAASFVILESSTCNRTG